MLKVLLLLGSVVDLFSGSVQVEVSFGCRWSSDVFGSGVFHHPRCCYCLHLRNLRYTSAACSGCYVLLARQRWQEIRCRYLP